MSRKPRILATRNFPPAVMERLLSSYEVIPNDSDEHLTADVILEKASSVDAIMCSPTNPFPKALIDALPSNVKLITTFSVGYDHLDVAAADKRGILLCNTPDVLTDATADIAILCMLGAARMAHSSAEFLRAGKWDRWSANQFLGVQVTGKKLGILGMGRIGQAVARRALGFDMEIHYHNRRPVTEERLKDAIYHDSLDNLLPNCDFLSINCGLSEETHYLLNDKTIAAMPNGAVLVNTARGPIVEDEALIRALQSGKLAAAGLDVFENEPNLNPGYMNLTNLFVLPHIGSATVETRNEMGFKCLDNLDAFFADKPLPSQIKI